MARFIMAGQLQAVAFVLLMTGLSAVLLPPLAILGNAAIALVTLRISWQNGAVLALVASVALALLYSVGQNPIAVFGIGLLQWSLLVFFAWLLYSTVSWDVTLQAILIFIGASMLLFHLVIGDTTTFWTEVLNKFIEPLKAIEEMKDLKLEEKVEIVAPWMTGLLAASFGLLTTLSLLLARFWQANLYNPNGFGEEFRQIRIGKNATLALVGLIVSVLISKSTLTVEMLMVGMVIFLFQGLSVVHALVKAEKLPRFFLVVLYLLMAFLSVQTIVMMAALAMIDNFVDLRKKLDLSE